MARVARYGAAKADRRLHNPAGFFEVVQDGKINRRLTHWRTSETVKRICEQPEAAHGLLCRLLSV